MDVDLWSKFSTLYWLTLLLVCLLLFVDNITDTTSWTFESVRKILLNWTKWVALYSSVSEKYLEKETIELMGIFSE